MFVLVGVIEAHYPEEMDAEERIALFTTKEKAFAYEKASRLKSYQSWCGRGQHNKQYRAKSLLSRFCHAYVDDYEPEDLIVDPEL